MRRGRRAGYISRHVRTTGPRACGRFAGRGHFVSTNGVTIMSSTFGRPEVSGQGIVSVVAGGQKRTCRPSHRRGGLRRLAGPARAARAAVESLEARTLMSGGDPGGDPILPDDY